MNRIQAAMAAAVSLAVPAEAAEERPAAPRVAPQIVRDVTPALATYTDEVLFADVWKRPDLAPRDRSLVTITALIALGQTEQLAGHLGRSLDNGVTQKEISEVITHLAFYAGWPRAMSAIPVAKGVFDARAAAQTRSKKLEILRQGSQPSSAAPAEYFTGTVRIDSRFQRDEPARIGGATVSFEAGARTAWHTHPLGQTLIVTSGLGWIQREGDKIEEIRPGDVVWIPPGEKHWHGATATSPMTHIAIAEAKDGTAVTWLEKVTDQQYSSGR